MRLWVNRRLLNEKSAQSVFVALRVKFDLARLWGFIIEKILHNKTS